MNQKKYNCKVCGRKGDYFCNQCGKVAYCSRECQFKDWNNHKNNCNNYPMNRKKKKIASISLNKKVNYEINNIQKPIGNYNNSLSIGKNMSNNPIKETKKKTKYSALYPKDNNKNNSLSNTNTIDTGTTNNETALKETHLTFEEKNNVPTFDFMQSLKEIIFMKNVGNNLEEKYIEEDEEEDTERFEENLKKKLNNQKILLLYKLLIANRQYIIEKVLLDSNKTHFFVNTRIFRDKFLEIEKYIFNYIFLIRFLYLQGDPVSLIKANQALNHLAKEMLDYQNNGLLVFSLNTILKRSLNVIKTNSVFKNICLCYEIIKKYLLLISCLIKLSKQLVISKLYHKFIDHYGKVFDLALDIVSSNRFPEKLILKSNVLFHVGSLFAKKNLLNSSIQLYKKVLNLQNHLDKYSFVYGASYYNISVIYYVMGDIKNCDLYLNEIFDKIKKYEDSIKIEKYKEEFSDYLCKLHIFSAEVNVEKKNNIKALENLKEVIKILEERSAKERHRTQQIVGDAFHYMLSKTNKKANNALPVGKSNSIVSNTVFGVLKDKIFKAKRKKNEKSIHDFLYEIEYFENPMEKHYYNEKIKEIVNGLFDVILFMQREKEMKLREIQINQNKNLKKENTVKKGFKRLKSSSLVYETDKNLLDVDAKTINVRGKIKNPNRSESPRNKKRSTTIFMKKNNNNNIKNNGNGNGKNLTENFYVPQSESKFIYQKTSEKILSYFNDEIVKKVKIINNEGDISDFKYFFILLTNLSLRQVEILNNTQNSNMSPELYKNLPIFFSRQFKNTLNPTQRNIFDKIRVLSLVRCKVLADYNKKITVDNINFNIFHVNIKFNDTKLKQYSDITRIVKEVIDSGNDIFKRRTMNASIPLRNSQSKNLQNNTDYNNSIKTLNKNDIIRKFISKRSRQLQQVVIESSNSSESAGESVESEDNENMDFKYRREFNLQKFKNNLVEELNDCFMIYSKDEIDNIIMLINSPVFVQMMNSLELQSIKDLDNDHPMLFELLKKELKRVEKKQLNQVIEKKVDESLMSESSEEGFDVSVDEKNLININNRGKNKHSADFSNFHIFQNKIKDIKNNDGNNDSDENNEINLDLSKQFMKFNANNKENNKENNNNDTIMRTSTHILSQKSKK